MQALRDLIKKRSFPEGSCWRYRPFCSGEVIVQQGNPSLSMYLIDQGSVQIAARFELDDGEQLQPPLSELGPGDVFGEFGLFEARPRTATVTGGSDGMLIEFDTEALGKYLDGNPALGYQITKELLKVMVGRLAQANERAAYLAAWGLTGRQPRMPV